MGAHVLSYLVILLVMISIPPSLFYRYPVAEFRALVERQVKALGSKQVEALKRVRHVEITLANLQDTLQELEESLRVETGALMQVLYW